MEEVYKRVERKLKLYVLVIIIIIIEKVHGSKEETKTDAAEEKLEVEKNICCLESLDYVGVTITSKKTVLK